MSKANIENFEHWCMRDEKAKELFFYNQYLKDAQKRGRTTTPSKDEFLRYVTENISQRNQQLSVNFEGIPHGTDFTIDPPKTTDWSEIQHNSTSDVVVFNTRAVQNLAMRNCIIRQLLVSRDTSTIHIKNSYIATVSVKQPYPVNMEFEDCYVGTLLITPSSVQNFLSFGGTIRNINCPLPYEGNPFKGNVKVIRTQFPTSTKKSKLFEGAQSYRNLRVHFENLQNTVCANLMRSLELKTERQDETGFTWFVNWAYGTFASYGRLPGLPLACLALLWILVAALVFVADGGALGLATDRYEGWQQSLIGSEWQARLTRSAILPVQATISPFGIFGIFKLVVAKQGWMHFLLSVQGLAGDVLLAMTLFGIRRRFKLQ